MKYLFWLVFFLAVGSVKAQYDEFGRKFLFEVNITERNTGVPEPVYISAPDTAVDQVYDFISGERLANVSKTLPKSSMLLGVKLNPRLRRYFSEVVQSVSRDVYSFSINDSSDATLIAMGINETNYSDFEYRVVQNDSTEILPWSAVPRPSRQFGSGKPICLLGTFKSPGNYLLVEVKNKTNYALRDAVIFDWRPDFRPVLQAIIVDLNHRYFNLLDTSVNMGFATLFDRITGVPLDFRFRKDSVNDLLIKFKKRETVSTSVHLIRTISQQRDTVRLGFVDVYGSFYLDAEAFSHPGKYALVFQRQHKIPEWKDAQLIRISFEVVKPPDTFRIKSRHVVILSAFLLSVIFCIGVYYRLLASRLRKARHQQNLAQIQLRSLRSQLNPHFMFNALNSIQNLVNQQKTREANDYLSLFANLTRSILNSSDAELVNLDDELSIDRAYLEMERLRFRFQYVIELPPDKEISGIQVPPMLLQPFIENAVKHGIAGKTDGFIKVMLSKDQDTLTLAVSDNGSWVKREEGFGIRLSRERIRLLNTYYPASKFGHIIEQQSAGTTVSITIQNWL